MTQDEIIALLEKAKLGATGSFGFLVFKTVGLKELTDFANFVAAKASAQTQEPEPVADDIASILACRDMLDAQPVPPRTEQLKACVYCGQLVAKEKNNGV